MQFSEFALKGLLKDENSYLAGYLGERLPYWWFARNAQMLLITLFDRILLTIGGRQRQSIAPA